MSDPEAVPQAILEAFSRRSLHVGALVIPPFTLGKFMLLHDLKSPLVTPQADITLRDLAEGLLVLMQDVQDTRKMLSMPIRWDWVPGVTAEVLGAAVADERDRRTRIMIKAWEDAVYQVADQVPATEMQNLGRRLIGHINAGFATAVPMAYPPEKGGGANFTPDPAETPESAGSPNSSSRSPQNTPGNLNT